MWLRAVLSPLFFSVIRDSFHSIAVAFLEIFSFDILSKEVHETVLDLLLDLETGQDDEGMIEVGVGLDDEQKLRQEEDETKAEEKRRQEEEEDERRAEELRRQLVLLEQKMMMKKRLSKAPIIRQFRINELEKEKNYASKRITELEKEKQRFLGQIGKINNKQKELRDATDSEIVLKEMQRETAKIAKEPVKTAKKVEEECRQS
jgi:hypothetical protein